MYFPILTCRKEITNSTSIIKSRIRHQGVLMYVCIKTLLWAYRLFGILFFGSQEGARFLVVSSPSRFRI